MIPNENRLLKRIQVMIARAISGGSAGYVLTTDPRLSDARAPTAHTHAMSDVTGLAAALGAKADTSALSAYLTTSAAAAAYYPLGTNPAGYLQSGALTPYLLSATASTTYAAKATTLAGYGITDAVTGAALTAALGNYTTTAALTTLLAGKADKVSPVYNVVTPALNTAAQISTTRAARVSYPVDILINSLLTDVEGLVWLEYADDAAFTTGVTTVMSGGQLLGGVINIKNRGTVTLTGEIPAGKYRRLRTQNVSGTPTYSARQGQEVLV